MAIFEENRLRPEEISGGFDAGTDNETFLLETLGEYPGELPDMFNLSEQIEETLSAVEAEQQAVPEAVAEVPQPEPELPTASTEQTTAIQDDLPQESTTQPSEYLFEEPAEANAAADDSVWDVFNQEQPAFDTSKEQIDFADLAGQPPSERIINENDNLGSAPTEQPENEVLSSAPTEQPEIDETMFASAAELLDPEVLMGAPEVAPAKVEELPISDIDLDATAGISFEDEPKAEEPISNADILGDDLKSLIEQDLQRSKSKKPRAEGDTPKELSDDEIRDKLKEFQPVGDSDQSVLIDLTAIQTDHPSSVLAEINEAPDNTDVFAEAEPKSTLKKEKKKKIPAMAAATNASTVEAEEAKPKKQRKPLPWKKFGFAAVILLIAGAIGFGLYYTIAETTIVADLGKDIAKLFAPDSSKPTDSAEAPDTKTEQTATAAKAEAPAKEATAEVKESKAEEKPEPKEEPKVAKPSPEHAKEVSAEVKETKPDKNRSITKEKPARKEEIAERKQPVKAEKPHKKSGGGVKDFAQITQEAKQGKSGALAHAKKDNSKSSNHDAAYTVEVYSSPSRDDAEEWVRLLAKRKVQGVFIKEQKIRDEVWYKVRFGSFGSKEEAKHTAEQHGFSHIWIDRVK